MSDTRHRTDTVCSIKEVTVGPQRKYWVEFQLLDEQGDPLPHLPYRAVNEATCEQIVPEFSGQSDANGLIRIAGLHPIPLTLLIAADPLADMLQTRRLRAKRPEPPRPGFGDRTPLHGPLIPQGSHVAEQARADGHAYHYVRIGQLCDRQPQFDPPLKKGQPLPTYHFPDPAFSGFTIPWEGLDRRHVLEVCPFRAWSLVLNHQSDYCLVTAYNLGLMSDLAYSDLSDGEHGSINAFFTQQCLDLSRTPRLLDGGANPPCVVVDVPFSERYTLAELLDTAKADEPEGDTQLFYAISATQVLVGWRGTEMKFLSPDLATDLTFRPVKPEVRANCEPRVPCADLTPAGSVHLGFRQAYEVALRKYPEKLGEEIVGAARGRDFFICGHSLGGALGLIHAAALKEQAPLLYTYGMPRTFSLQAVDCLAGVRHFRHTNDTDLIPDVPPEADLDNRLYDLYGPLGTTLGTVWSVGQLLADAVIKGHDPFYHHGEIAAFYRAEQHIRVRASNNPAYRMRDGLGAPYHTLITKRLPAKAKLFLVPSLNPADSEQADQAQQGFQKSLDTDSLQRYFPKGRNVKPGRLTGLGHHFINKYLSTLHNQLIESIDSARMQARQALRSRFEAQMDEHGGLIPENELTRNRAFLSLQQLVDGSLHPTRQIEGGNEALERFNAVAEEKSYEEPVYG